MSEPPGPPLPQTERIVWGVLLLSQLVYLGVAASGVVRIRDEPLPMPLLPIALAVVSLGAGVAASILHARARVAGERPHPTSGVPGGAAFTSYLVAWVIDEIIAINGLVVALLAFSPDEWLPFFVVALLLTVLHRPRTSAGRG
jgi:hypothetical protein